MHVKLVQWCLTLCDPMDCSPPGSSAHGILQVRILEWVALPSSRGSSRPTDRICISCKEGGVLYIRELHSDIRTPIPQGKSKSVEA